MAETKLSRRDFIKITAMVGGSLAGGKMLLDLMGDHAVAVSETRIMMGTIINLTVVAESRSAGKQAVEAAFFEMEHLISFFDHRSADSLLAVLNRTGKLPNPPTELVELLSEANEISQMTAGAFDVTMKPLMDLYQNTQPELPGADAIQSALALVNYRNLELSANMIRFTQPGMAITLDGIAKGFIVDAGTSQLRSLGFDNVLVEAGGDMMASGSNEDQQPWKVGVQSPRTTGVDILGRFSISNQAAATSGDYMQCFTADMRYHHIIDPHNGYSAPHLASATVIALSCAQADALATAFMVMNPEDGLALVDGNANIEALLIGKDLQEFRSSGFR